MERCVNWGEGSGTAVGFPARLALPPDAQPGRAAALRAEGGQRQFLTVRKAG